MKNFTLKHLLLIAGGVLLGILIYLAPHISPEDSAQLSAMQNSHEHIEIGAVDNSKQSSILNDEKSVAITAMESRFISADNPKQKINILDSLIALSIKENKPPLVANYTEQKAVIEPTVQNWFVAGDNYFKAFRLSSRESELMVQKAIYSYEKVLEMEPSNIDAETSLAVAHIEGAEVMGEMPMKGIGMLLKVLEKDPNNVNALTNLGYFAIQSGQYDKAIERFEKVLELEPENAEAYLYLTDVYVSKGEPEKGIEFLEKYKSLVNDPLVEQQVNNYIEEIRNNNIN